MTNWKQIERTMELTGSDDINGWSFRSALRKVGRGIKRGARGVARGGAGLARGAARGARRGLRAAASLPRSAWSKVSSFIPGRDRGKAAIVRRLNAKLVREHANFLQIKDLRGGVRRPRAAYLATSKPWSRGVIRRVGLPTKLAGSSATASNILGDDVVGDWWNPLSWFAEKEEEAEQATQEERAPDEQVQQAQAEAPVEAPIPEEGAPEEAAGDWGTFASTFAQSRRAGEQAFGVKPDESESEGEGDFVGKLYRSIKDPLEDIDGDSVFVDGGGNIVRGSELTGDFVGSGEDLFGAEEERAIEASGDADMGRRFRRDVLGPGKGPGGLRRFHRGMTFTSLSRALKRHGNPMLKVLKMRIKAQLEGTKVVSKGLVRRWAAAKAGGDTERRRHFFRKMKAAINRRGGTVSRSKSETAGC